LLEQGGGLYRFASPGQRDADVRSLVDPFSSEIERLGEQTLQPGDDDQRAS